MSYKAEGKVVKKEIKPKKKRVDVDETLDRLNKLADSIVDEQQDMYKELIKMREKVNAALDRLGLEIT